MARKSAKKLAKKKGGTGLQPVAKKKGGTGLQPVAAPVVRKELSRCCVCGSTTLLVLRKSETEHHGVHDGERYTSIIRQKVHCTACGKVQMVVSHPYDPKKWTGAGASTETEKKSRKPVVISGYPRK